MSVLFPAGFRLVEVDAGDAVALDGIRFLFRSHQSMLLTLGVDIAAFQGFEDELAGLPGKYGPAQGGRLFLLWKLEGDGNQIPAGSIAIHRISAETAEIKRLFVNPDCRGLKLGELLSLHIMDVAAAMGYTTVVLDTLERLPFATALYTKLGFKPVPRYNDNPMHDVLFFGRSSRRDDS
jgi:GNAT superfamily N-acetyltransferase